MRSWRAFPGVRFFAVAAAQVSCLVEMAADDVATRRPRLALALAAVAVTVVAMVHCPAALNSW